MLLHTVGAVGPVLLLGAYYLVSTGRVTATAPRYQAMNLVGSLVLLGYSAMFDAWVSVVLNAVWALIAGWGLLRGRG